MDTYLLEHWSNVPVGQSTPITYDDLIESDLDYLIIESLFADSEGQE